MEITEEDIKNGFRYKSHQKFDEICHNIEGERYTSKYGVGPNGGDYCILTNDEKMQLLKILNNNKNIIPVVEIRYSYKTEE